MAEWIVTRDESGLKLLSFILQHMPGQYSARAIKKMIEQSGCIVNGRTERFANTIVGLGDRVSLSVPQSTSFKPITFDPSRVLYEDEVFLAYDKPPGVNCDVEGILSLWRFSQPSIRLIHRLDRDTTGVLLLAKTKEIYDALVEQFKQKLVKKRYMAIVDGSMVKGKGFIENYLGKRHSYAGQSIWGAVQKKDGLYAYTDWELLDQMKEAACIACYPKTGRTHQIRVHMAGIGHPILGDFQYGKGFRCRYRPQRMLLHAESISFLHPQSAEQLLIAAPLPNDFKHAQRDLEGLCGS